jgi:bifunctional DNase/RNase
MLSELSSHVCLVCGDPAIVHFHVARGRRWAGIHHACEQHIDEVLARYFYENPVGSAEQPFESATPFDIEILLVRSDGPADGVYYLRQPSSGRYFCSTMGYCESAALYLNIESSQPPRPGTHVKFAQTISLLGGLLKDVIITGFLQRENCFCAHLRVQQSDKLHEIDIRPSDALNLAIICNVPIFVSELAWRTYMRKRN